MMNTFCVFGTEFRPAEIIVGCAYYTRKESEGEKWNY